MKLAFVRGATIIAMLGVSTALVVWSSIARRTEHIGQLRSAENVRACATLLAVADVTQACPRATGRRGLRVRADAVPFSKLFKCGVSITATGAYTFYVSVDVFPDASSAFGRFHGRRENVVTNSYYTVTPGSISGLGDAHISYTNPFRAPELNFQRDHVYVEIEPSGGDLCRPEELQALGRVLYERAPRFVPHAG